MRRETTQSKYQSRIVTTQGKERLVYQVTEYESLVEKNGQYFIKNTESGCTCYRGIDSKHDLPAILEICEKGV